MQAIAKQKHILMSARKLRRSMSLIKGKSVIKAINILRLTPYDANEIILKKLIDALHNAKQKYGFNPSDLVVSQAIADEGKTYKRIKPRAQGRLYKREKPTSHILIAVSNLVIKEKSY